QEAEGNVPGHGRCQRRSAQALAVEISAALSQALSAIAMRSIRRVLMCAMWVSAAALAAALATQGARSAGVEDFYRGKTVSLLIGYSVGGGYDAYGRLLARHFGKHLPGNPSVVPQNMSGAGSLKAANYLYSVAPKDGSVIGTFSRSQGIAPLLDKAEFDSTKFTWLGSVTDEVSLCVTRHDAPVQALRGALGPPRHFWQRGRGGRSQHFRAALPQRLRRQDQDRDRLSRHQRDPARDRARRGRRALRAVVEHAQRPLPALAHGQ